MSIEELEQAVIEAAIATAHNPTFSVNNVDLLDAVSALEAAKSASLPWCGMAAVYRERMELEGESEDDPEGEGDEENFAVLNRKSVAALRKLLAVAESGATAIDSWPGEVMDYDGRIEPTRLEESLEDLKKAMLWVSAAIEKLI